MVRKSWTTAAATLALVLALGPANGLAQGRMAPRQERTWFRWIVTELHSFWGHVIGGVQTDDGGSEVPGPKG